MTTGTVAPPGTVAPSADLRLEATRSEVLRAALAVLEEARVAVRTPDTHRSLRRLHFTTATFAQMALMSVLPFTLLILAKPWLMQFWYTLILWWAQKLNLPLSLALVGQGQALQWLSWDAGSLMPSTLNSVVTGLVLVAAYAATFWMSDRQLPFKYGLRTVCIIQASASLFFVLLPTRFPYTLHGHLAAMLEAGYFLMLVLPFLLALGWGVLRVPLHQKLLYPLFMLAYFAVMLPHKALLHGIVLQHFSLLFMPLLYLCFGAVLDLMVFVALYSWLASLAPVRALEGLK